MPSGNVTSFDSILVRLKGNSVGRCAYEVNYCFDSILVRLKDDSKHVVAPPDQSLFRFHTGSIKSVNALFTSRRVSGFDSILVRLKERLDGDGHLIGYLVSIPYWFD